MTQGSTASWAEQAYNTTYEIIAEHPALEPLAAAVLHRRVNYPGQCEYDTAMSLLRETEWDHGRYFIAGYRQSEDAREDVADTVAHYRKHKNLRGEAWRYWGREKLLIADLLADTPPACEVTFEAWKAIRDSDIMDYQGRVDTALKELDNVVPLRKVDDKPAPDNGKVETAQAFRLDYIDDLGCAEPEFLIDGLLETNTLAEIHGRSGDGKTFGALDIASCVAGGVSFHGRDVMQGAVVYIAGEGRSGLLRRRAAWRKHHGRDGTRDPFFLSERAANFRDGATMAAVNAAVDQVVALHGFPRLIVIDTVARNFGSGDENSTMDMGEFVCGVDDLRVRYPGSVILLVHHSGHAEQKRARGSSALRGALDAEYLVEKSGEVITITSKKMKDAEEPAPISFELRDVVLGIDKKGREFGSAVLVLTETPAKEHKLTPARRFAIETFREAAEKHGVRTEGAFHGVHLEDWRKVFYQKHTSDTTDGKKKAFQRARENTDLFTVNDDLYLLHGHGVEHLI